MTPHTNTDSWLRRLPLALVVLAPLIMYAHVISGLRLIIDGELALVHYPFMKVVADSLARGDGFPLWTPHVFFGYPVAANLEVSLFYPFNLPLVLFPEHLLYLLNLVSVLHLVLGGLGAYRLARRLGLGEAAAGVAGLVFSLNGFTLGCISQLMALEVIAWAPWLMIATARLTDEITPRTLAGAGAVVGLMLLAGMLQYVVGALLLCGAMTVFQVVVSDDRSRILGRAAAAWAMLVPLGIAAASVQLAPARELAAQSARESIGYEQAAGRPEDNLKAREVLHLISPAPFARDDSSHMALAANSPSHVGLAALVLALVGLLFTHRPERWLWFGMIVVAFLVAAGPATPLFWAFYYLLYPLVSMFKDPNRYLFLATLPLALLAAYGTQRLTRDPDRAATIIAAIAAVLLAVAVGLGFAAARAQVAAAGGDASRELRDDLSGLLVQLAPVVFVLAAMLPPLARLLGERTPLLATLAVALGLLAAGADEERRLTPEQLSRWTEASGMRALLQKQPTGERYLSDHYPLHNNLGMIHGLTNASGQSSLVPRRHLEYSVGGAIDNLTANRLSWQFLRKGSLAELASVRSAVVREGRASVNQRLSEAGYRVTEVSGGLAMWRREALRPRAWFVDRVHVCKPGNALETLLARDFVAAEMAVVEGIGLGAATELSAAAPGGESSVAITSQSRANELTLTLETDRPRLLVVNESWFPGWSAYIDGREVPLLRVNHIFRGVAVPAGRHGLVMRYWPPGLTLGLAVSAAAWLGIAVLAALPTRRAAVA